MQVLRYEITEVQPDRAIVKAMDKQAIAERDRSVPIVLILLLCGKADTEKEDRVRE